VSASLSSAAWSNINPLLSTDHLYDTIRIIRPTGVAQETAVEYSIQRQQFPTEPSGEGALMVWLTDRSRRIWEFLSAFFNLNLPEPAHRNSQQAQEAGLFVMVWVNPIGRWGPCETADAWTVIEYLTRGRTLHVQCNR
jgi:hypothetical protein